MANALGRPLVRYTAIDFSGGLDVKTSQHLLASVPKFANRIVTADNVVFPRQGGVSKRLDYSNVNTDSLGASVAITGGTQFRLSDGTDLDVCGTTDGRVVLLNSDGTTTDLTTGQTADTRWYFAQFNDLLLIGNRADAPMSYDGAIFGNLAGSPPMAGGPVAVHGNRAFWLDDGDPRIVTYSVLDDAEDYTGTGSGSFTVTGRLSSPLIGLLPMTSELLLGHRDFVTRLQGTAPATYSIENAVPAQVSLGPISPQGMIFANNDAWWISQRGIHNLRTTLNFGDLRDKSASDLIDPYFTPNTDFTISLQAVENAVACYDQQTNRLLFGVDTDADGENDMLFVRDVYTGAWSIWPDMPCASLWTRYNATLGVQEVYMGGYDGRVRVLNQDVSTNAIDASFTHVTDLRRPNEAKTLREIIVHAKEEGNATLFITVTGDFGAVGGQTFAMSLNGGADTLGSTFTLGVSTLGARSQIIKRLQLGLTAEYFAITFANAIAGQSFTLFSYEAFARPRRILGRGVTL